MAGRQKESLKRCNSECWEWKYKGRNCLLGQSEPIPELGQLNWGYCECRDLWLALESAWTLWIMALLVHQAPTYNGSRLLVGLVPISIPCWSQNGHRSDLGCFYHCSYEVVINVLMMMPCLHYSSSSREMPYWKLAVLPHQDLLILFSTVHSFQKVWRLWTHCIPSSQPGKQKHVHLFFLWMEKLCQRGMFEHKKIFYGVKLNDNYKSVLCACLIAYFLCPKGKKRKVQCVFRQPMETFLVRWVFIGTLWHGCLCLLHPDGWTPSERWVTWNL